MSDAPPWELYRSFLALIRERSLSAGARRLRLTQPTLGRHLAELEERLGATLFTRSPQGLTPTATALELEALAVAMESAAEAMGRAARRAGAAIRGPVRIAASVVVGAEVLPGLLKGFADAHPEVEVELVLSNRTEDLLRRDADIAVRMVAPEQSALLAQKIGAVRLGLFARKDYLERHGEPRSFAEAAIGHRLIGFDREPTALRTADGLGLSLERTQFALRVDNDLAQLAAIRAGYGLGACQVPIAARDPMLQRVLGEIFDLPLGVWLVMHEDLKTSPTLRAVFDHLALGLKSYLGQGGP